MLLVRGSDPDHKGVLMEAGDITGVSTDGPGQGYTRIKGKGGKTQGRRGVLTRGQVFTRNKMKLLGNGRKCDSGQG